MAPNPEGFPESDRFEDAPHPRETCSLFGHGKAENDLLRSLRPGNLPPALMIGGPPGIGKATLAWRLARFLLAIPEPLAVAENENLFVPPDHPVSRQIAALAHPDLVLLRREWNEEAKKFYTQIQVDDVRRAAHLFHQAAGQGGWRICIIDSAEDLNQSSANALLKLVEEPPPRSLFLIIAHRPGRMLPTLRSRCRNMLLRPLEGASLRKAIAALGPPWSEAGEPLIESAIAHSQGSVQGALRLLDENKAAFNTGLRSMFGALPAIDWGQVHALADRVAGRGENKEFEAVLALAGDWLGARVRTIADGVPEGSARRLAPYAAVWEKLTRAAREAEIYNLDKRPLILSLFAELAAAERAACL